MFPNQLILCIICLIFSSVHTEKVSIKYKMLDETNRLLKDSHAKKINPFITNTLSKVLLLAVEGLTPSLLSRVATPALDRLASRGSLSRSSWLKKTSSSSRQTPVWSSIYDLGHSPGWCLSSPPRLCPPWQPLPPASTLRLVRISQRVHVMIVAGDWNIGHRGLAR